MISPDPLIRTAAIRDVQRIARIHVCGWLATYRGIVPDSVLDSLDVEESAAMWQRVIEDSTGGTFVYVAESNGVIEGFVSGGAERSGDPEFTGEIFAIYLDPARTGRGIGRNLLISAVERLTELGHTSMLIWALTENPAGGFYRHLGGVEIRTQLVTMGRKTLEETAFGWRDLEAFSLIKSEAWSDGACN